MAFAGRELNGNNSNLLCGVSCSGISGKLKSNTDFLCRRCLEGEQCQRMASFSQFAERGCD